MQRILSTRDPLTCLDGPSHRSSSDNTYQVQPGSSRHHLKPFLSGCHCLSVFQQLRLRLATAPGKAVPAPCPEVAITSASFPRLQAANREAFLWLTPSITQHNSTETAGQQELFPSRQGRQQFHTLHTPYPSEELFLDPQLHLEQL